MASRAIGTVLASRPPCACTSSVTPKYFSPKSRSPHHRPIAVQSLIATTRSQDGGAEQMFVRTNKSRAWAETKHYLVRRPAQPWRPKL